MKVHLFFMGVFYIPCGLIVIISNGNTKLNMEVIGAMLFIAGIKFMYQFLRG